MTRIGGGADSMVRICTVEVCVRSKSPVGQIKCVLFVAGRMIRRRVQGVEAMPLVFDVWTVGERETHPAENLIPRSSIWVKRMQRTTSRVGVPGKRNVDAGKRVRFFFSTDFFCAFSSAAVTALRA